jgi:hypothetical protein
MEQRLLRYIMTPAMGATWIFGIALVFTGGWLAAGWFHVKFALVIAMTIMHGLMGAWAEDFRYDRNKRPQRFYRIANEIPTVLMIAIVTLAVVKPFYRALLRYLFSEPLAKIGGSTYVDWYPPERRRMHSRSGTERSEPGVASGPGTSP